MDFLFKNIGIDQKNYLLKKINILERKYLKGETIAFEGDKCSVIVEVKNGLVTAKNVFFDGHETIIKKIYPGFTFGEALLFSSNPYYKASFICERDSTVKIISLADVLFLTKENNQITLNLLSQISDNLIELNKRIKILSKKTVLDKIKTFLYFEYLEHNNARFKIIYSKTELAKYLSIERPTISKNISFLVKEKIIKNTNKDYEVLDLNKLIKEI